MENIIDENVVMKSKGLSVKRKAGMKKYLDDNRESIRDYQVKRYWKLKAIKELENLKNGIVSKKLGRPCIHIRPTVPNVPIDSI
jgi:hypothetical protein